MSDLSVPRAAKWPFLLGDTCMLAAAAAVAYLAHTGRIPWSLSVALVLTAAVAVGAWILVTPFLRDQEAEVRLREQENLAGTLRQIQQLERAAESIGNGTLQLQASQQAIERAQASAQEAARQIAAEHRAFGDLLQRQQDAEKQALRIELEKLRRGEEETVRVLCHILDHVYAVYQAGIRSNTPGVPEQFTQFRGACLDASRRLGLVAHEAQSGEPFNPQMHQTPSGKPPAPDARVLETYACGYTLRGQPVRPIIVRVDNEGAGEPSAPAELGAS